MDKRMTRLLRAVTHSSKFHADDVFSTVVLRKLYPDMHLTRTRDSEIIAAADIAYDLGGVYDHAARRYDHHQIGARKRADTGITYSAFGLIWDHYGLEYCEGDADVWRYIDDVFVRGIDADDNYEFAVQQEKFAPAFAMWQVIRQLNPIAGGNEEYDEQFEKAVALATDILERMRQCVQNEYDNARMVREAQRRSPDPRYAELDRTILMNDIIPTIEGLEFLILPDGATNYWRLSAISTPDGLHKPKCPLPAAWAGLRDEKLANVTGVQDAIFCHKNRHLAVAQTRDGACALLEKALKNKEES